MLHRVRDLRGRHALLAPFVDEAARLVDEPLVALAADVVEGAFELFDDVLGLVPDRGLDLAGLDERDADRCARTRELVPLRLGERLDRVLRRAVRREPGDAMRPPIEPMCTMRPWPARNSGIAACVSATTAKKFTSNTQRQSSSVTYSTGPPTPTPALLTSAWSPRSPTSRVISSITRRDVVAVGDVEDDRPYVARVTAP